jgi:hypothetical protein
MPTTPDAAGDSAKPRTGELEPAEIAMVPPTGDSGARDAGRYQILAQLGGDLHSGRDRVLDRSVQVRVADTAKAGDLEREARFVARLAHPGVLQIHDFVRGDSGAILVQDNVEGVTLADAIAAARAGRPRPELASTVTVVQMMRRLCDALCAAHARGVVHRSVSPAVITLGWHGQVVLGGWSAAMVASERPMTQRFVSTAPAPQTADLDDLHADVRALGACLFEALVWRPIGPRSADPSEGLDAAERRRLPPPLAAVVRQALASDQSMGYHSMAEFGEDLDRFLAGVPLEAYEPGLWIRLSGWAHRRQGALRVAGVLLALAAIAAGAAKLAYDRYTDRWGPPLVKETFDDNSWRERWVEVGKGSFLTDKGRLVSQAPEGAVLVYRQRLVAPVAIEYTGQILPGTRPCDLSVIWSEREGEPQDLMLAGDSAPKYMIQAGAVDNSSCCIYQLPTYRRVAHANRQLETGRDYRFRVEIDGERVSMAIDGQKVTEFRGMFPASSGYLMLYGYYPGKAFDDVVISRKLKPAPVTPVAAGDALYQFRHFDDAAAVYARIAASYPGQPVGQQALFRKGLAEREQKRIEQSRETWSKLTDPRLHDLAECLALEDLLQTWQIDTLANRFDNYYRQRPAIRSELRQAWQKIMHMLEGDPRRDDAASNRLVGLRDSLFPEDSASAYEAAYALLRMERYADILVSYPDERATCVTAKLALGRTEEVLKSKWEHGAASYIRGDFDSLLQSLEPNADLRAVTMCKRGWAKEALRDTGLNYPAQLYLGQAEQLLASLKGSPFRTDIIANDCLIALGRFAEAAGAGVPGIRSGGNPRAMLLLGQLDQAEAAMTKADYWADPLPVAWARLLVAAEAGRTAEIAKLRPQVTLPRNLARQGGWFAGLVIGPFIDRQGGDAEAMKRACEQAVADYPLVFSRRPWFLARYVLGQCSEADLLAMPAAYEAPAWLAVGNALRAELAGRPAEALAAYRAFAAMPLHQRLLDRNTLDVQVELFVAWRIRALSAP